MAPPRAGVLTFSAVVVVALVAAIVITIHHSIQNDKQKDSASTSAKVVMCHSAEYKDTCHESLRNANSDDPKDLMRTELEAIMNGIHVAIKKTISLSDKTNDDMTKQAIDICGEVLEDSIDSLKRSFDRVGQFQPKMMDEYLEDLKIWVSGVLADQTVCREGFKNTTGDFGEKMEKILESSRKLTITALDMIDQLDNLLGSIKIQGVTSRRLLAGEFPGWVDSNRRRLLAVNIHNMRPDVVVANDGSGKYKTINEALKEIPRNKMQPFVIHVKEGIYEERVSFLKHMTNVVLTGDGPTKTRITGCLNYVDGVQTFKTSTVSIVANDFIAKDIGFENTSGPKGHQAVALRVQADKALFINCHVDGYQDTLYAQKFRQFYRDCTISGTVDFIFGDAAVVFQNCNMVVRKPGCGQKCMVTAQGKDAHQEATGTVLQNCVISAEPTLLEKAAEFKVYLGRPWQKFATTIIIQSEVDGIVDPTGWAEWTGTKNMETCYYAEYGNRGAGAALDKRVSWKGYHRINIETAQSFVPAKYLLGDTWIPQTGIPYIGMWMNV